RPFSSTAAAMAFDTAKSSSPSLAAKLDGKRGTELGAKFARNKAFAHHFQTLMGRARSSGEGSRLDGPAQEAYDNRAYPSKWIGAAGRRAARAAADAIRGGGRSTSSSRPTSLLSLPLATGTPYPATAWTPLGPDGVPVSALQGFGTSPTIYSGRATAIAVDPNCRSGPGNCTVFIGAAGGGVWKTTNALDAIPTWTQVSDGQIPSNAIGSIRIDPIHSNSIHP